MATEKINNTRLNLTIDSLLLLLLLPMAGIGFIMKYTLLSGVDKVPVYGSSVDLAFLGLTRHEWGTIHLVISLTFMALLLLHIILHWTCIENFFRKTIPSEPLRISLAVAAILFILLTLLGPFFIRPEKVPFQPQHRNRPSYSSTSMTGYYNPGSGYPLIKAAEIIAAKLRNGQ